AIHNSAEISPLVYLDGAYTTTAPALAAAC
ncbi:hypothetical protein M2318_005210, partial [Metapseudomonas resinovorans]